MLHQRELEVNLRRLGQEGGVGQIEPLQRDRAGIAGVADRLPPVNRSGRRNHPGRQREGGVDGPHPVEVAVRTPIDAMVDSCDVAPHRALAELGDAALHLRHRYRAARMSGIGGNTLFSTYPMLPSLFAVYGPDISSSSSSNGVGFGKLADAQIRVPGGRLEHRPIRRREAFNGSNVEKVRIELGVFR